MLQKGGEREKKESEDKPAMGATGEQEKEELIARLVSMVQKLMDRMDEMENKMHKREKFTVPVATYATAAAQNAGPGGTVKFINSEEPMALMAMEQERLKERRLQVIVRESIQIQRKLVS
jgi:hypothetical protein